MFLHNRYDYSLVTNYTVRLFAITYGSSHDSAPYFQELKPQVMGFIQLTTFHRPPLLRGFNWEWDMDKQ